MGEQALDLKRVMHIVRRHWIAVLAIVVLGLVAGAGYTAWRPPQYSSSQLLLFPTKMRDISTQAVVVGSEPVLAKAARRPGVRASVEELRRQVQVQELTPNILSVIATGSTARGAEHVAVAVAASYVSYVSARDSLAGKVEAHLLPPATSATRTPVPVRMALTAALGALLGGLIGIVGILGLNRGDKRLRFRDEMADTVGTPVLASLPVWRPKNAGGWVELLDNYEASALVAWRLRNTLRHLGLPGTIGVGAGFSLSIVSLASDRKALALGPQLAAFAASQGITTELVIGSQRGDKTAAVLRGVCAGSPRLGKRSARLRVTVADRNEVRIDPDVLLTVVVTVADGNAADGGDMIETTAAVLGLSPGVVTAEQVARVASAAADAGMQIDGILVANPDHADHTSGQLPRVTRQAVRIAPTRLTGPPTETMRWTSRAKRPS